MTKEVAAIFLACCGAPTLVGMLPCARHRSVPEIHRARHEHGVEVAERAVTNRLARLIPSAAALGVRLGPQWRAILALDELEPDVGREVLWVVRDCLSGEVLLARGRLSEAQGELVALLRQVRDALLVLVVRMNSGEQSGLRHAVAAVVLDIPHQLYQYQYLREVAKPIYEADRHAKNELTALVRDMRPTERTAQDPCYTCGKDQERSGTLCNVRIRTRRRWGAINGNSV